MADSRNIASDVTLGAKLQDVVDEVNEMSAPRSRAKTRGALGKAASLASTAAFPSLGTADPAASVGQRLQLLQWARNAAIRLGDYELAGKLAFIRLVVTTRLSGRSAVRDLMWLEEIERNSAHDSQAARIHNSVKHKSPHRQKKKGQFEYTVRKIEKEIATEINALTGASRQDDARPIAWEILEGLTPLEVFKREWDRLARAPAIDRIALPWHELWKELDSSRKLENQSGPREASPGPQVGRRREIGPLSAPPSRPVGEQREPPNRQRLTWQVLPEGWWNNPKYLGRAGHQEGAATAHQMRQDRIRFLSYLRPRAWYEGADLGRRLYVVALFDRVAIAESAEFGNALYYCPADGSRWQTVFRVSKREALRAGAERIIHDRDGGWQERILKLVLGA